MVRIINSKDSQRANKYIERGKSRTHILIGTNIPSSLNKPTRLGRIPGKIKVCVETLPIRVMKV